MKNLRDVYFFSEKRKFRFKIIIQNNLKSKNMKKSIIIIAAICIANFVFAQDVKNTPKNSIGVRVGTLTAFQNHDAIFTALANPFSQGLMGKKRESSPTFQYGASYGFDVSKKVTISVIGAYQEIKGYNVENTFSNEGDRKSTRLNSSHPSISRMPSSA